MKRALNGSQVEYYVVPPSHVSRDLYLSLVDLYQPFHCLLSSFFKKSSPGHGIKFQLQCNASLEKFVFKKNKMVSLDVWFLADTKTVLNLGMLRRQLNGAYRKVEKRFDAFVEGGSGWVMKRVLRFSLCLNRFKLFRGGCERVHLPASLMKRQCCLSIHIGDSHGGQDTCFLDCLVAGIGSLKRNPSCWCALYSEIEAILLKCWPLGCDFPISSRHWRTIDRHCPISINIYGYEKGSVFPLFLSVNRDFKPFHVDLLLCREHYYLVRNLSALVSPQTKVNRRKCFICPSCLSSHVSERKYRIHLELCRNDCTMYQLPDSVNPHLEFSGFNNMVMAPFVIYSDLETFIRDEEIVQKGKLISRWQHVPISVAALMVYLDRVELGAKPFIYTGLDCVDVLLQYLDDKVFCLKQIYDHCYVPCRWSRAEKEAHEKAEMCFMCKRKFADNRHLLKVRDHCHISGRYQFALCSQCNLTRAKRLFEVTVLFHGLSNYDSHFLVRKLASRPMRNINVIPRNSERYLTLSYGCLHFKDSYQFLACSLATLVENLKTKGEDRFRSLHCFIHNPQECELMTSKGVFPYSYVTRPSVLLETKLPARDDFYNDLDRVHITEERYAFAQKIWKVFKCHNLMDYLHIYLLADCLLLADVFENYRDCCLADYRLDPVRYFSSPHFTFDAFLLFGGVRFELLTDVDQYLFLTKAM